MACLCKQWIGIHGANVEKQVGYVGYQAIRLHWYSMDTSELLTAVDSEIATLKQARALLAGNGHSTETVRGPVKKRTMSAEARERIAAAQRKRWAKQKKAAKKGA